VHSKAIQFSPKSYQNLNAALENREYLSIQAITKNIWFLSPVSTRQYLTSLAQSRTDDGES